MEKPEFVNRIVGWGRGENELFFGALFGGANLDYWFVPALFQGLPIDFDLGSLSRRRMDIQGPVVSITKAGDNAQSQAESFAGSSLDMGLGDLVQLVGINARARIGDGDGCGR